MTYSDGEYEQIAIDTIRQYKNKDYTNDEIREQYPSAINLITDNIKRSLSVDQNIKQMDQGPRKTIYKDTYSFIDDAVKLLLGKPFIRMY